jgi:hypothetical protein
VFSFCNSDILDKRSDCWTFNNGISLRREEYLQNTVDIASSILGFYFGWVHFIANLVVCFMFGQLMFVVATAIAD